MNQLRNVDLRGPDKVRIIWTREMLDDTDTKPSDFDCYSERSKASWRRGSWRFVGIIAKADVWWPIGGGSYAVHTFRSTGLWGVESNTGKYLDEVFEEQKAELLETLKGLGAALATGDFIDQSDGRSALGA